MFLALNSGFDLNYIPLYTNRTIWIVDFQQQSQNEKLSVSTCSVVSILSILEAQTSNVDVSRRSVILN